MSQLLSYNAPISYSHQKRPIALYHSLPVVIVWLLAHVVLSYAAVTFGSLTTLHALLVLMVGVWFAVNGNLRYTAFVGAYVAGAEVFWRMTHAAVPWEYGKYTLSLIFLVALFRKKQLGPPLGPTIGFLLLLPSIWLTMQGLPSLEDARQEISFNLSGPFALIVAIWFFSKLNLNGPDLQRMLLAFLGPAVAVLFRATFSTIDYAAEIRFTTEANFVASGGFGPNQVASVFAFAIVACFVYLLYLNPPMRHKGVILGLLLWFIVQAALTFSRTGLVLGLGASSVLVVFLLKSPRFRLTAFTVGLLLWLFGAYVAVPFLNEFTGGAFEARYTELSTTNRTELALADILTWWGHPILGVGPGMAKLYRTEIVGIRGAAHTELTRLLSEHGIGGLFFLILLTGWVLYNLRRTSSGYKRGFILSMALFVLMYMATNAFRLVLPAFVLGLLFAAWTSRPYTGNTE